MYRLFSNALKKQCVTGILKRARFFETGFPKQKITGITTNLLGSWLCLFSF